MVARAGFLTEGRRGIPEPAYHTNWSDADGRGFSPEQNTQRKISPQVQQIPSALQRPERVEDSTFSVPNNTAGNGLTRRGEVLPLTNNPGILQRHNIRGEGNTGRWQNLGKAPTDGHSIGFDYWEKVLINPSVVALGNVVGETQFNVTIRNSFRRDNKTVTAIDNNAGAGIIVTGAAPPTNLPPLYDKIYVVTVSTDGPPNIDGTIDWTATTGILSLSLTGTRIIIFPYPPQSEIKEDLRWLTDIIKAADGSEQRHSLRVNPRQRIEYEIFTLNQADVNYIRNLMIDWTTRVFGVPIWWNEISLASDVTALDTVINVRPGSLDTADFRPGGLATIYQEDENGNVTIDSLQIADVRFSNNSPESIKDQIEFATPISNNYDGSLATVIPVYPAILQSGISADVTKVGDTVKHSAKFEVLDNLSTIRGVQPGDYPELNDFEGRPTLILDDKIFIDGDTFSESYQQKAQRIDFKIGKFTQLTQELKARRTTPVGWRVEDELTHWKLRALFYHLRGKWKSVWLPTWRQDFIVNTNIGNGATTIDIDNQEFYKFVENVRPWAGLRIEQTDGTTSYHRITSSDFIDTTTERLTITPSTPNAITIEQVERVDLMVLSRLTDDNVSLIHNWIDAESEDTDVEIDVQFIGDLQT
jgi:hypothetical protein